MKQGVLLLSGFCRFHALTESLKGTVTATSKHILKNSSQVSLYNGLVSLSFQRIIESRELCQRDSIFPVQCPLQKKVADMRIFGQKRSMKISAYNIAVEDAFTGVLSVVAVAVQYFAKGQVVTYVSSAAVVFKTDDLIGQCTPNLIRQLIICCSGQCSRNITGQRLISKYDIGD